MDTNLFLKEAKAKFNHNAAKDYLNDKYQNKLILAEQGGLWKVDTQLLSFLSSLPVSEHIVLLDLYDHPIKVIKSELFIKALNLYNEVMEEYHDEWNQLRKKR